MTLFDDGKDTRALRTIGEVSAATGIKQHVLRYWEEQFPSLKPLKRAGGRRLYRPEDVAMVRRIASLVGREGYTLRGAKAALAIAAPAEAPVHAPVPLARETPVSQKEDDLLPRLMAIRAKLASALAA